MSATQLILQRQASSVHRVHVPACVRPELGQNTIGIVAVTLIPSIVQMTALHHLTRLRTLAIEVDESKIDPERDEGPGPLAVLPTPAPSPLRRLLIDSNVQNVRVSCPNLRSGAVVQLKGSVRLTLTSAAARLVGCRLEISAQALTIAFQGQDNNGAPHRGSASVMDHLFRWFRNCGADCIALLHDCSLLWEERLPLVHLYHLKLNSGASGEEWYGDNNPDAYGPSEYMRRIEQHSVRHGFQFAQSERDGNVVFTRTT